MKHIRKTGWVAVVIAMALAGSQVPRLLHGQAPNFASMTRCTALPLSDLAAQAMSNDPDQSKSAIDQLRDAGPAGLDALLDANKSEVAIHRGGAFVMAPGAVDSNWPKIRAAIDAVAAQRDAYASGLYWYTDFARAQAAARASGKPILSLRLLGNLNDEYSCANSRFFRTVLYANSQVSKELREKFILHWQSVRPVPVITIDFGDGRKIRRTITGNSIHYVLTAEGKVVDGIPGLYGPKAFLRELAEAEKELPKLENPQADASASLRQYHADEASQINLAYSDDMRRAGVGFPKLSNIELAQPARPAAPPTAAAAAPLAVSKSAVEIKAVEAIEINNQLPAAVDDQDWSKIAALHAEDALLDPGSEALIAAKSPDAATAARRAMSKMYVETPLIRTVRNFQRSIAEDTVRNEYLFHLQIHRWLADPANANLADDVAALNNKVYAELFLTPGSDPWLGLVPADTYSALDDDGVCH